MNFDDNIFDMSTDVRGVDDYNFVYYEFMICTNKKLVTQTSVFLQKKKKKNQFNVVMFPFIFLCT